MYLELASYHVYVTGKSHARDVSGSCMSPTLPGFGRSMSLYRIPRDSYISASGNEIYRLNLDPGRFMIPLVLQEDSNGEILGVNTMVP